MRRAIVICIAALALTVCVAAAMISGLIDAEHQILTLP